MLSHAERLSRVTASIDLTPPVAAFGGGKYRTPVAAGLSGKRQARTHEAFTEVREAFRRVAEVHQGARKSSMQTRQTSEMETLAQKLSRNRKLGSKQFLADEAHAAELYHQRRRIASSGSLTERRKNKLDPSIYPVMQMRNSRFATAADLLDQEYARRAGYPPMRGRSQRVRRRARQRSSKRSPRQRKRLERRQPAVTRAHRGGSAAILRNGCGLIRSSGQRKCAGERAQAAVSARGAGRPASARGGATGKAPPPRPATRRQRRLATYRSESPRGTWRCCAAGSRADRRPQAVPRGGAAAVPAGGGAGEQADRGGAAQGGSSRRGARVLPAELRRSAERGSP